MRRGKVGIFGGRFDPIHTGHLIIARDVIEEFQLDRIIFLVSFNPPHKPTIANFEDRFEMVKRAIVGEDRFEVSSLEKKLGLRKTYTALVLEEFKKEYPQERLFFLVGADQYIEFPRWYHPEMVLKLAKLIVLERPEVEIPRTILKPDNIVFFKGRVIAISSTEIRERIKEGKSIRYLVPESVRKYIRLKGLYKTY